MTNISKDLLGKTALITGGSSGIGLASAKEFLDSGAKVYITGRNMDSLIEAQNSLDKRVEIIQADSTKMEDIIKTKKVIEQNNDKLDILFYNAGVAKFASLLDSTEDLFEQNFSANTKGAFFTVQVLEPLLRKNSSVIFNGTFLVHTGFAGASAYTASKAALGSLAKTFSSELVEKGVRVNVINTGPTATPLYGKTGLPEEIVNQLAEQIQNDVPMKRFGQPEEIAKVAKFLASDASSYMLGAEITVDGGFTQL